MQQAVSKGEMQRTLAADDVAGVRYGMSGIDELTGTADDYWIDLQFVGESGAADIVIGFDNAATTFAQTNTFVLFNLQDGHKASYKPKVYFSDQNVDWHFNDTPYVPGEGDIDLDGDVDDGDIMTAFSSFTGPGICGATRSQGDIGPGAGDRDVDVSDLLVMFAKFTGSVNDEGGLLSAEASDPAIPDLVYNPANGEVILDVDGSSIIGYSLKNLTNSFLPSGHNLILGGVTTSLSSELAEAALSAPGGANSVGFVFPTGLDLTGLTALLSTNEVSRSLGSPIVPFDLVVLSPAVPESSTYAMAAFGLLGLGLYGWRRKRA